MVIKSDEIVISGVSLKLPESENFEEFAQNLLGGHDMVTDDPRRWPKNLFGLPSRAGKIKTLNKFDASFFGFDEKTANSMDPQLRILLELTFEALLDSGTNPDTLRGSKTGVFLGISKNESQEIFSNDTDLINDHFLTGYSRSMAANQLSQSFDFTGPSMTIDTACSSSLLALERAVSSIRLGQCDSAIVAGSNILLTPEYSLQFHRLNMLSIEGKCKAFDKSGKGYVRSEAVVVIYLQKSSICKRAYTTIVHAKTNSDGYKPQGITYPSGGDQRLLLEEVYSEAGIDPASVSYVEAHGTGTKVGDPEEINAITQVFCTKSRPLSNPLLIGSVKSNLGHSEPTSGLCSIAKMILAYQTGIIGSNLHFSEPNPDIPGLHDGRLKVIHENYNWKERGIVGVNAFGFGGSNVHVILAQPSLFKKKKKSKKSKKSQNSEILNGIGHEQIPPLILPISGRDREGIDNTLKKISLKYDPKLCALLHEIHNNPIKGQTHRGFSIISDEKNECDIDQEMSKNKQVNVHVSSTPQIDREIWLIFSGMGTQWKGMGRELFVFEPFKKSIQKSQEVLKKTGFNLVETIFSDCEQVYENLLNSFVCIAAVQIAIFDLLKELGIKANGIIGHSVGENTSAYADGCASREDTLLGAYWAGKIFVESNLPKGGMAAVGLTWNQALKRCPSGVFPACHNALDSITISGPTDSLDKFVTELQSEGIFAKCIPSGQAFHSPYIYELKTQLVDTLNLNGITKKAKRRSNKWISTSIPEADWDKRLAERFTTDYWANNLISPVLFQEAVKFIPSNSIVIEIAPHALLQAILKRSLPTDCIILGTMNRSSPNNAITLLSTLGKLFCLGINPNFGKLYKEIKFPVPLGTSMISNLINWNHDENFSVATYDYNAGNSRDRTIEFNINSDDDQYLYGHNIDGRVIFPPSGYIYIVWKLYAKKNDIELNNCPVIFEKVVFHKIVYLTSLIKRKKAEPDPVKFLINILEGSGKFEVIDENDGELIASGIIRGINEDSSEFSQDFRSLDLNNSDQRPKYLPMDSSDIYHEFELRGFQYNGVFKAIKMADNEGKWGCIQWEDNWISFLDSMMQFKMLYSNEFQLALPKSIQKAIINPNALLDDSDSESDNILDGSLLPIVHFKGIPVRHMRDLNIIKAKGVEIRGLHFTEIKKSPCKFTPGKIEEYQFTPYFDDQEKDCTHLSSEDALEVCMDMIMDNLTVVCQKLKFLEVSEKLETSVYIPILKIIRNKYWGDEGILLNNCQDSEKIAEVTKRGIIITSAEKVKIDEKSCHLIILENLGQFDSVDKYLCDQGFVLIQGSEKLKENDCNSPILHLVSHKISKNRDFYLFRKKKSCDKNERKPDLIKINVQNGSFDWVKTLKIAMAPKSSTNLNESPYIYLISSNSPDGEILGLVDCLKREPGGENIRCVFSAENPHINEVNQQNVNGSRKQSVTEFSHSKFESSVNQPGKSSMQKILDNEMSINVFQKGKKGEIWGTYRKICRDQTRYTFNPENAHVSILSYGNLSSLSWLETHPHEILKSLPTKERNCKVYYSALNFRDVLLATGKLPESVGESNSEKSLMGMEFSGKLVENNQRVMGIVPCGALSTSIVTNSDFIWPVPQSWTLEDAATVPLAYATAYYALIIRGDLKIGESILIHSGSDGIGQAAISIALSLKCTVFTTVSNSKKKLILQDLFPHLRPENIGSSSDSNFEQNILEETCGEGVDVILNVLSQNKLQASLRCLAIHGRFLELGRHDLSNDSTLGIAIFLKNISFHGIIFELLFQDDSDQNKENRKKIIDLVNQGIKGGVVKPLSRSVFGNEPKQLEKGFRYLASGQQVGKIIFQIREEDHAQLKSNLNLNAIGISQFDGNRAYIIIGGLCKFGLQFSSWLIERGVKNLFIVTRAGISTGYQDLCMRKWNKMSVQVETVRTDVTTLNGALRLIQHVLKTKSVGGIFNLAMGMKDGYSLNQTADHFMAGSSSMIKSTQFLDIASRKLCQNLDYFVIFSNVSSIESIDELSCNSYGLVNQSLQRICERRKKDGLPALAIQWGSIDDTKISKEMRNIAVVGKTNERHEILLSYNTLDYFFRTPEEIQKKVPQISISNDINGHKSSEIEDSSPYTRTISSCSSKEPNLIEKIVQSLELDNSSLPDLNLSELGLDSLLILEIKCFFEKETGIEFSSKQLSRLSLAKLNQIFIENSFR